MPKVVAPYFSSNFPLFDTLRHNTTFLTDMKQPTGTTRYTAVVFSSQMKQWSIWQRREHGSDDTDSSIESPIRIEPKLLLLNHFHGFIRRNIRRTLIKLVIIN